MKKKLDQSTAQHRARVAAAANHTSYEQEYAAIQSRFDIFEYLTSASAPTDTTTSGSTE